MFTKTVNLLEEKELELNSKNTFTINENLKINYKEYNDLVKSFQSSYNLIANSNLKILLHIKTIGKTAEFNKPFEVKNEMTLTIPLTENTISINMDYRDIDNRAEIVKDDGKFGLTDYLKYISYILVIIMIILIIADLVKNKQTEPLYNKTIKNKLKNYDRMIVSSDGSVKIDEYNYEEIVDVLSFKELVDVAERLTKLITWTEIDYSEDLTVSWFTVEDNKRLYRIIYKSTDTQFK